MQVPNAETDEMKRIHHFNETLDRNRNPVSSIPDSRFPIPGSNP